MSLIRQIRWLLAATMLLAFAGSFALWIWSSRDYLQTQLRLKNADNAQALALSLSQQGGDLTLMDLTVSAQFDTGFYRTIRLRDPGGRSMFEHELAPERQVGRSPDWFAQWVPIESHPGVAQVTDGWKALGTVEVVSHPGFAHEQLWAGAVRTGLWLILLWGCAAALAMAGVRAIRERIEMTIGQARALMERRFVLAPEPATPELAELTRAMNAMVGRVRILFDEQAAQVDALRRQAHCDTVTGLSQRAHFIEQLRSLLERDDGPAAGRLHLIRLGDLSGLNRRLGHRSTDELLSHLARGFRDITQGIEGAQVGRLNGGDFAIVVTEGALPPPEGEDAADVVRRVLGERSVASPVGVGSTRWVRGQSLSDVLAAADAALARAEVRGDFAVEKTEPVAAQRAVMGEDVWRRALTAALDGGRLTLAQFDVVDVHRQRVHFECPARLPVGEGAEPEPASNWLAMASRLGLVPRIDEQAIVLALAHIAVDGIDRCVNVSSASLREPGWLSRVVRAVGRSPESARRLWLEWPEQVLTDQPQLLRDAAAQLRPLGVRVGLEHAGERISRTPILVEIGLDYVKLDGSVVRGLAQSPARQAYVSATAALLSGIGLQVMAEGVEDAADLPLLWASGVQAATGPAVAVADGPLSAR